jgi:hypothetical protein
MEKASLQCLVVPQQGRLRLVPPEIKKLIDVLVVFYNEIERVE